MHDRCAFLCLKPFFAVLFPRAWRVSIKHVCIIKWVNDRRSVGGWPFQRIRFFMVSFLPSNVAILK